LTIYAEHLRAQGIGTDDAKLVRLMQQRTGACLGHWRHRGYLKSYPATDLKGLLLWEIADNLQRFTSYDAALPS
jgi:hypothetical protein